MKKAKNRVFQPKTPLCRCKVLTRVFAHNRPHLPSTLFNHFVPSTSCLLHPLPLWLATARCKWAENNSREPSGFEPPSYLFELLLFPGLLLPVPRPVDGWSPCLLLRVQSTFCPSLSAHFQSAVADTFLLRVCIGLRLVHFRGRAPDWRLRSS